MYTRALKMINTMETIIGGKHEYKQSRKCQYWIVSNKKLEHPLLHTPNMRPYFFLLSHYLKKS